MDDLFPVGSGPSSIWVSARQLRLARTALGLKREDAASHCCMSLGSMVRCETKNSHRATIDMRKRAAKSYQKLGVVFFRDGESEGIWYRSEQ